MRAEQLAVVRDARTGPARRPPPALLLLGGWAFLLPVQVATPLGLRLAPSDLLLLGYLALRLPWLRRVPAAWSPWTPVLAAAMGLGLLVALVRTGSVSQYALLQKGLGLGLLLLAHACVVDAVTSWDRARWLLRAFLWGALLHACAAVLAFGLTLTGLLEVPLVNQPYPTARLSGLLVDPNAFGGLVGLALVLHLLTSGCQEPLLGGRAARLADVVLPLALVLTFSRSAWIGVVLALGVASVAAPRTAVRAVLRTALPVLVAVPVLLLVLAPDLRALVSRPDQIDARLVLAQGAVEDFLRSPLVGTGVGVNAAQSENIIHNTALWFLAEFGLVGFVAFAGFAVSNAVRAAATARATAGAERALAVALLAGHGAMLGLSTGIEALYQRHWWLVLGVAGALHALTPRRGRW